MCCCIGISEKARAYGGGYISRFVGQYGNLEMILLGTEKFVLQLMFCLLRGGVQPELAKIVSIKEALSWIKRKQSANSCALSAPTVLQTLISADLAD
uniref:Uncharacterized protein n=1 Tax=Cannabis sativa TaxID=3483 RepID=A0A803P923_CANSA